VLWVLALFFISGATALVFETLWMRMLALVFGATSLAQSTVLAVFMGGLALGSILGGRLADRVHSPLRAYAACEGAIGLYALGLPWLLTSFPSLSHALPSVDSFWAVSVGRFLLASAVMLLPTTLMGATLPLLARHAVRLPEHMGRAATGVSRLFAANTFGAVAGAFSATFILLPVLGLRTTHHMAAAVDLAVAACALLLARRASAPDPLAYLADGSEPPVPLPTTARRLAVIAFAMSGAAAMANQVLWTRALTMVIGSSIYSFTLVLLAFLLGLAGGAAAFSKRASRASNPLAWLCGLNLCIAILAGWTYLVMDDLPEWFLGLLRGSSLEPGTILMMQMGLAMAAVFPATVPMGATLPFTIRAAAANLGRLGRDVGAAYSANTVGAIVGSFMGGFLLLPVLGIRRGLAAAAITNLCLVAMLGWTAARRARVRWLAPALALLTAAGFLRLPEWDLLRLSSGPFRISVSRDDIDDDDEEEDKERPELVFYRDGLTTTVSVEKWKEGHVALKNNGKVDASSGDDMPTQIMVGLLPVLLHPDHGQRPLSVLVIGYASGVTVGSVLQAGVERVDVVELERATIEASRFFEHVNHRPLSDPRVRLTIDDGRNWLAARDERYDVIISEPSNPWITGVSNLFTVEYFRLARERLAPGGVFCSWAQLYEMSPLRIKSIYRAFSEAFPGAHVFSSEDVSSDTMLIATRSGPPRLDLRVIERAFRMPKLRAELRRAHVRSPHDVAAFSMLTPDELAAFVAGVGPNTDDNLLVELRAPLDLYAANRPSFAAEVYASDWPYSRVRGCLHGWDEEPGRAQRYAALAESLLRHGKTRQAEWFLKRAGAAADRARRLHDMVTAEQDRHLVPLADEEGLDPPRPPPAASLSEQTRFAEDYLAIERRLAKQEHLTALGILDAWPDRFMKEPGDDLILLHGFLLYMTGQYRSAAARLRPLADAPKPKRSATLHYYGLAAYASGHYRLGVEALLRWLDGSRDTNP